MNNDWLDINILEDYLDGKLDARTMNRVEREALEDPFVAEALAGLSNSPKKSLNSLSILQKQLKARIADQSNIKKTSVITWQRLSIAATAAVLFISVSIIFWMRESNNRQLSAKKQVKKTEIIIAPKAAFEDSVIKSAEAVAAIKTMAADKSAKTVKRTVNAAQKNIYNSKFKTLPGRSSESALSGKVISSDGAPLSGVEIKVNGTSLTASTDAKGEFSISADSSLKEGKISANYIGFESAEMLAKANQPVKISLRAADQSLNEVAVVGYGTQRKKSIDEVVISKPVGGWDRLFEYINKNNKFNSAPRIGKFVTLAFNVSKDGRPADIKIVTSLADQYDKEAVRLLNEGPKWEQPGNQNERVTLKFEF